MYALLNTSHTFCPHFFTTRKKKKKKKKTADDDDDDDDALGSFIAFQLTTSTSSHRSARLPRRRSRNATARAAISNPNATPTEKKKLSITTNERKSVVGIHGNLPRSGAIHIRTFTCHENAMETRVHVPSGFRRVTHGFGKS